MKNNYQDHREACKKENCASCNFDEGKLGGWDRSHRAGAVLAEFKDKTLQGIVAELGWKTTKTADKRFSIPCKCLLSLTYNRLFSSIYQTHYQYNCVSEENDSRGVFAASTNLKNKYYPMIETRHGGKDRKWEEASSDLLHFLQHNHPLTIRTFLQCMYRPMRFVVIPIYPDLIYFEYINDFNSDY